MQAWFASFQTWLESFKEEFILNFVTKDRYMYIVKGLGVTLKVTFFAVILGIVLGFIIAIIRSTHDKTGKLKIGNLICRVYLTVVRGTPVLIQLMIIYFVIFAPLRIDKVMVAIIAFGLNSAAYVAEIVRGGLMSVNPGQMEAGRSLGLNYAQTMRLIVIPQAIKNILPALGNEMITLLKDTSLVSVIALRDVTKQAQNIVSNTYQAYVPYVSLAIIYLVLVIILTKLLGVLERRLRQSDRR